MRAASGTTSCSAASAWAGAAALSAWLPGAVAPVEVRSGPAPQVLGREVASEGSAGGALLLRSSSPAMSQMLKDEQSLSRVASSVGLTGDVQPLCSSSSVSTTIASDGQAMEPSVGEVAWYNVASAVSGLSGRARRRAERRVRLASCSTVGRVVASSVAFSMNFFKAGRAKTVSRSARAASEVLVGPLLHCGSAFMRRSHQASHTGHEASQWEHT